MINSLFIFQKNMARIVFTWELGNGYGHISKFILVAKILSSRGHRIYCIATELHHLTARFLPLNIKVLQAPVWQKEKLQATANCYAELLLNIGYYDSRQIEGKVMAWQTLYDLIQPDLLIADHSPTALLAARNLPFPKATLGSGFFTPPFQQPVPAYYPDAKLTDSQLHQFEQNVLLQINDALHNLDMQPLDNLSDIFQCEDAFYCTFKEIDHYATREPVEYMGAQFELPNVNKATWPDHDGPKIFAYLKSDFSEIEKLLQALKLTEASIIIHIPDIPDNLKEKYSAPHINFYPQAIDLETVGAQANLAICHAGHGTIASMLTKSCPLILIPTQMEQLVLALRIKDLGAAEVVTPGDPIRNYRKIIKRLLSNPDYQKQANAFANRYADINPERQREKIADRCEALLDTRQD